MSQTDMTSLWEGHGQMDQKRGPIYLEEKKKEVGRHLAHISKSFRQAVREMGS